MVTIRQECSLESGEGDDRVYCKCHIRHIEEDEIEEDEAEAEPQMEIAISGNFDPTAFTESQLANVIEVLNAAKGFLEKLSQ